MCKKLVFLLFGILAFGLVGNASGALPAGWNSQDVGAPLAGSADESGGVWTITANGNDIWGTGDNCHMAYIMLSGSCEVIAQVMDVGTGANNWAKGGVMIRETLDGNSANAFVGITPSSGGGCTFQIRPTAGAASTSQHTQAPNVAAPYWVKLVRKGDVFTAWRSPDGVDWTQQGAAQTVVMAEDVYVGIAVTSHEAAELRTYTLENVYADLLKMALEPAPTDGEVITETYASLQWTAGPTAVSHDVYFGESYDDVMAGTGGSSMGNQTDNWLLVGLGSGPYPDPLELGKTYYWRVDEVESDGTTHTGDVWTFSLPTVIAQDPQPADDTRFVDIDADLSWAAGFGAILHTVYFGDDYDTVLNDTTNGVVEPYATHDPGTLENGKTYYWRVDELDNLGATRTGEVWSFRTIPAIPIIDPNLVAWWKMNEGEGDVVVDWSGYGHHATFRGDPQWTTGYDASGLSFTGTNGDYLVADGYKGVDSYARDDQKPFSICAWVNTTADNGMIVAWGGSGGGRRVEFRINGRRLRFEHGSGNVRADTNMDNGTWRHVVMTVPRAGTMEDIIFYLDGEVDPFRETSDPTDPLDTLAEQDVKIGRRHYDNSGDDRFYTGLMDDVRIYDRVLTQAEIQEIMLRPDPFVAWEPTPVAGSVPQIEDVSVFSWSPGESATQHDVYFGTDANSVRDADSSSPEYKGRQAGTSYSLAGEGIVFGGGPYYWRVDEIKADSTMTPGNVWTFTVADYVVIDEMEDYNNYSPDRIFETWVDGWGIANNGSQVGYLPTQAELDAGANFVETGITHGGAQSMPLYYNNMMQHSEATMTLTGLKRDWTRHGVNTLSLWVRGYPPVMGSFAEGPAGTYTMSAEGADIWGTADGMHFAWKMLSGPGSITAKVDDLAENNTWTKAGVMIRETLDANSVNAMTLVAYNSYRARMQYRTDAGGATTGTGDAMPIDVVPHWIKLERDFSGLFTAYHANDVGGAPDAWAMLAEINVQMDADVYIGLALTSHAVGDPAYAVFSNVSMTGTITGAAWTAQDIGITSNAPEPMYVAVQGATGQPAIVPNPDVAIVLDDVWSVWNIPLSSLTEVPNLADIESITVGLGTRGNQQPGGSGLVFVDDVRLYPSRCFADIVKPTADFSNNCVVDMADLEILSDDWLISGGYEVSAVTATDANLLLHYEFEGNANDSSGNGYDGVVVGSPTYVAGPAGQAISFDGIFDYIAIGDVNFASTGNTEVTVAAWVRTVNENNQGIVSFDRDSYWRLEINGNGADEGEVGFDIMTSGGVSDFGSNSRVDDGQWHHIAAVFDKGQQLIYIDGVIDASRSVASTFGSGTLRYGFVAERSEATEVNGTKNYPAEKFTGEMDDLRIYTRALPHGEIANLAGVAAGGTVSQPLRGLLLTNADSDLVDDEKIDFKDYAALIGSWLDEQLWP